MANWLRLILMLFYAPVRGMREVRDRGSLAPDALLALIATTALFLVVSWLYPSPLFSLGGGRSVLAIVFQAAGSLVFIALVLSPLVLFVGNLFERRASYRLVLQQEYSGLTSTFFYTFTLANLVTILIAVGGKLTGVTATFARRMLDTYLQQRAQLPPDAAGSVDPRLLNPEALSFGILVTLLLFVFGILSIVAIRVVLRFSAWRSILVMVLSSVIMLPASVFLMPIFSLILGSPFLLLMVFLVLRGYFSDVMRYQRARESFRQNMEAATLNPADASAHYNLGLIHQQRGELDAARERFERAVQIDEDEIDAHYQLGRIARSQKRLGDAVKHFEQVVARNQAHAQYEVWREVGSTYLAANQFEDARMALDQFLEHRPSDPEGLYLLGRAHAGLGHQREAESLMEKCIEAVKTSPAYKYRASKRWLNEAQQFLRSQV
jgi:tetratricopeptide (TPR) repeat protein